MSEPLTATEETEAQLEELGARTLDEIVLPGDEGPGEAEPEPEPAAEPATETAPEATEAPETPEEGEEGGEAPVSVLQAVREKLQAQAGGEETKPQDTRDLELAQLRQQALLQQQEDRERLRKLEAQVAGKTEPEPEPEVDTGQEARVDAAAKFYEDRFGVEADVAREMAVSTAEQARIEADLKLKAGLAPIEKKWAEAEEYQKQQEAIQQSSQGLAKGVVNLANSGGTELELAQDFQQNGFNSLLGRALGNMVDGDASKLTEILNHKNSALLVEQAGAALARRAEAYARGEGPVPGATASTGSGGLAAKSSPRSRGATKPTPKASNEEAVAAELEDELGGAEAVFSFLSDGFKWESP